MKIRLGFVSNSSSSSFVIKNKSNQDKTLKDFVIENRELVDKFNENYNWNHYTLEQLICSVTNYPDINFPRHKVVIAQFGDEDNNPLGAVYDYALRDFKSSNKDWEWRCNECRGVIYSKSGIPKERRKNINEEIQNKDF